LYSAGFNLRAAESAAMENAQRIKVAGAEIKEV